MPRRSRRAYAPSDLEGDYDPRFLALPGGTSVAAVCVAEQDI